jgi:hypothetical protein
LHALALTLISLRIPARFSSERAQLTPPPYPQSDLDDAVQAAGRELRIARQGSRPLGRDQQAFNRLLADLQRRRESLGEWQAFEVRYQQQLLSKLAPLQIRVQQARRDLLLRCDDILAGRRGGGVSGAAERRQLVAVVLDMCSLHLQACADDAAIIEVHDRHSAFRYGEPARRRKQAADLAGEAFAAETETESESETETETETESECETDPEEAARAAWEAREASRRSRQAARVRQREAERAAAAEQAARAVGQSVREVYRKLAGALHPDRGNDAADRIRRHGLMQRANQSYDETDLLGLLTLQLEIEQIGEDHLTKVPETKLRHYNQVLREQLADLDQALQDMSARYRAPTPQLAERDLKRCIADVRGELEGLRRHAAALLDPGFRLAWLGERNRSSRR